MIRFRSTTALFLLCFIVLFRQILSVADETEGGQLAEKQPPPTFHRIVSDTIALLRKSHRSSWEKIKTIISDMQLEFLPPNLEVKGKDQTRNGVGEKMKEAVKKSVKAEKAAVEESAKFAGEAMHKTAEKVKESVSDRKESRDEL